MADAPRLLPRTGLRRSRVVKRARDGNVRNRTFARETASARERERERRHGSGKGIIFVLTLKEYRWFMDISSYSGFSYDGFIRRCFRAGHFIIQDVSSSTIHRLTFYRPQY